MGQKTPLYQQHVDAGARIVDFGGWDMPLHYGSQLDEHHIVRSNAGMFDVSHMTVVDVNGEDASSLCSSSVPQRRSATRYGTRASKPTCGFGFPSVS